MGVNGFGAVLPLLSLVGQPVMVTLIKEPPLLTMHRREVLGLMSVCTLVPLHSGSEFVWVDVPPRALSSFLCVLR